MSKYSVRLYTSRQRQGYDKEAAPEAAVGMIVKAASEANHDWGWTLRDRTHPVLHLLICLFVLLFLCLRVWVAQQWRTIA